VARTLGKPEHHYRFEVWLSQAQHDLAAAKHSVEAGFYEWGCFQSEQAAEKALKSIIVYHGRSAPKLHRLGVLVGIVKNLDTRFRGIHMDIADLQSYTFTARYPFLVPGSFETPHDYITVEDANLCIHKAQVILNLIKELLRV
jgi:HEPN domain-containing protein